MDKRPLTHRAALAALLLAAAACGNADAHEAGTRNDDPAGASDVTDSLQDQRESASAPESAPPRTLLTAGTSIRLRVDERVSTESHATGQRFRMTVQEPVQGPNGVVQVPAGAVAWGRVTEAHESTSADDPAVLAIALEGIEIGGASRPIAATATEVAVDAGSRDSSVETAGKIAVGAAAGAILGQVLGKDTESTLKGAGVGAVAGTIVALSTRDGHAVLPQGSTVTVRLDAPLRDA
ncbi:MAG: hypothetical protein R3E10_13025 [Gemmatimonadota bacterium]